MVMGSERRVRDERKERRARAASLLGNAAESAYDCEYFGQDGELITK